MARQRIHQSQDTSAASWTSQPATGMTLADVSLAIFCSRSSVSGRTAEWAAETSIADAKVFLEALKKELENDT